MRLYSGSYTPASSHEKEGFYFSLLFIGYAAKKPFPKRIAWIFMGTNTPIICTHENTGAVQLAGRETRERLEILLFSLWAPRLLPITESGFLKHDYDKALKNPIHDKTVPIRDTYRREQAYKSAKHSEIKFQVNDGNSPKFGEGNCRGNRATVQFRPAAYPVADDEVEKIDQKWYCCDLVIQIVIFFTKPNKLIKKE